MAPKRSTRGLRQPGRTVCNPKSRSQAPPGPKNVTTRVQYRSTLHPMIDAFKIIGHNLSKDHIRFIDKTPFRHLFHAIIDNDIVTDNKRNNHDLDSLLKKYVCNKGFYIGDEFYFPTKDDIQLLLGLEDGCRTIEELRQYSQLHSNLKEEFFAELGSITVRDVKELIGVYAPRKDVASAKNTVKFLCLLLIGTLFFPTTGQAIAFSQVYLVDKFSRMRSYDWSAAILRALRDGLSREWSNPRQVRGCIFILPYWFCERCSSIPPGYLRPGFPDDRTRHFSMKAIPRLRKWNLKEFGSHLTSKLLETMSADEFSASALSATVHETRYIRTSADLLKLRDGLPLSIGESSGDDTDDASADEPQEATAARHTVESQVRDALESEADCAPGCQAQAAAEDSVSCSESDHSGSSSRSPASDGGFLTANGSSQEVCRDAPCIDVQKQSDGDENVAPIVAEAGSATDAKLMLHPHGLSQTECFVADDASLVETVAVLDNQDPERDSRQFEEEARRTEASLIAEPRKENGKSKEEIDNRKNFPKHVNRLSRIDNVYFRRRRIDNVDHQSPGDTTSSRVRYSTEIRSCHPQVEAAGNTSACVTANESFSLNIENTVSNAATLPPQTPEEEVRRLPLIEDDVVTDIPVSGYKELVTVDTEAGLSTRKKSKKRKKTSCGGSDFPSSGDDLSCELAVKEWKKWKQALQAEKHKLEASHSQKDQALTLLQKYQLALKDEVSNLKGQLKQKDEALDSHLRSAQEATKKVEEMVASLDQERAAAILKYKASPRFADECQIVMAPLLPHGYTLGADDAKAPDLDIGSLANRGQGDETDNRFKELANGQDILTMYKPRSPARELANSAPPDQAKALDHTKGDENVAPIVAEAGSVNDDKCCTESFVADDASSEKTFVLLDNQDPEKDSCPFEEACRPGALLIAELRKENEKLKKEIELYRNNSPEHVNQISRVQESVAHIMENNVLNSRVDNVDDDTASSRIRNSTEIRSCHQQIEATNVKKQRVSPSTTTTTAGGVVVDRAEPPLIINVESDTDNDSDSDVSITDSFMDALVGRSKQS